MRASSSMIGRATLGTVFAVAVLPGCKKPEPVVISPREVEAPAPDPARLAQTEAAEEGRAGKVKVTYCIDPDGKPQDVNVVESFGDPQVDTIVVETVQRWRYEPATRDGEPYEACTDYTFDLRLGGQ